MKDHVLSKTSSLVVFLTLFIVFGCTHSPTNTAPSIDISTSSDSVANITPRYLAAPVKTMPREFSFEDPIQHEQNIWQYIANNSALSQFYEHPRVLQQKQNYLNKPDYLATVTRQSQTFIHFVLNEVEKHNLPVEIAILPIIESNYLPKARSHAKAVGLWQFMPYTAKEYGLRKMYDYDGRHDVYASTVAALDYLKQLNKQFDGNWLLSLAAYNAGPHRIKRALKNSVAAENENIFWNLKLPRETQNYIPKILALASILSDKKLSNNILHPITNKPHIESITINKRISPRKLIKASGIDSAKLRKLNPALHNFNNPIPNGYHLLVPKQQAQLIAMTIDTMPEESLQSLNKYLIKSGDSLSVIATQHETSVAAIQEANNLFGNKIIAGQTLLIPTHGKYTSPSKYLHEQTSSSARNHGHNEPFFYIVATGDSFWGIASRNNTTVDRLAIINGRNPNQPLRPGESILID